MPRYPVNEPLYITTEFGVPTNSAKFGKHAGLDFGLRMGDPVFAPVSGTVTDYVWSAAHGHTVQIFDGQYYHKLCHNSVLLVKPGDKVTEGQQAAKAGSSGLSDGPHSHYDISPSKFPESFDFINPHEFIKGASNTMNQEDVKVIFPAINHTQPTQKDIEAWTTISASRMATEAMASEKWLTQNHYIATYPALEKEVVSLRAENEQLKKELAAKPSNFTETNVTQDGKPLYKKG